MGFVNPVIYVYACNTLTPWIKGMPEPIYISHIALPTSDKDLVIENGGSTFYVHLHGGCTILMYTLHFSLVASYMPHSFIHSQALMCLVDDSSVLLGSSYGIWDMPIIAFMF